MKRITKSQSPRITTMDQLDASCFVSEVYSTNENEWFVSFNLSQPPFPHAAQAQRSFVLAMLSASSNSHSSFRPNFFALQEKYPSVDWPSHVFVHLFMKPTRWLPRRSCTSKTLKSGCRSSCRNILFFSFGSMLKYLFVDKCWIVTLNLKSDFGDRQSCRRS